MIWKSFHSLKVKEKLLKAYVYLAGETSRGSQSMKCFLNAFGVES